MIVSRSEISDVNCNNSQVTFCDTFRKLQSRLSEFVIATYIVYPELSPAVITHCRFPCNNFHLRFNKELRGTAHR